MCENGNEDESGEYDGRVYALEVFDEELRESLNVIKARLAREMFLINSSKIYGENFHQVF